jgi:hypothetical protein
MADPYATAIAAHQQRLAEEQAAAAPTAGEIDMMRVTANVIREDAIAGKTSAQIRDEIIAEVGMMASARTPLMQARYEAALLREEAARATGTEGATGVDDPVRPKHYQGDLVARIIEHFELGFHLGNVIKYVLRHKAKAGLEDLKKAAWYLQREIEIREGKHQDGVR